MKRVKIPFMSKDLASKVTVDASDYKKSLKQICDEYGFVVVENILSKDEMKEAENLVYEDLLNTLDESVKVDADLKKVIDSVKSGSKHWPKSSLPGIVGKGFLSTHGMPQGKFAWKLRTNQKVKEIYQFLHGDDDLVVGTDVAFLNTDSRTLYDTDLWPHADQNIDLKTGSENSYQGILYVWGAGSDDSSATVVWPKSWKNEYKELQKSIPASFGEGHGLYIDKIPDATIRKRLMDGFIKNAVRVTAKPGSIVIFNSRTIHQGFPSGYRLAQPICWEPRKDRDEDALLRKLQAVHMGIATTHWASLGIHHGASFLRNKVPTYDKNPDECVFPMKPLVPVIVKQQLTNPKSRTKEELAEQIKPEYLNYL